MKTLKYWGILFLSLIAMIMPVGGIGICLYFQTGIGIVIGIIVACIGLFINKPLQGLRIKYRTEVEYDEFGRSKSKGRYESLSKSERDQIDLQKTLDMERVMNSAAIKKITK